MRVFLALTLALLLSGCGRPQAPGAPVQTSPEPVSVSTTDSPAPTPAAGANGQTAGREHDLRLEEKPERFVTAAEARQRMNIDPNVHDPRFQNAPAGKKGYLVEYTTSGATRKPQAVGASGVELVMPDGEVRVSD